MSHIIIGAYAHVDGGKTTLSEAILHKCAVLRSFGRVDHEDSFLDYNSYERRKGITVFTKEARFSYKDKDYVYVDTPGHLDFVGEVNRSFEILDAAIVQKLLPKLHGSRKKLEPVLAQLWKLCFTGAGKDLNIAKENVEKAQYKESADKIRRMYESATANGFTSFAEA